MLYSQDTAGPLKLYWTFAAGESIRGKRDVFWEEDEIGFSAETMSDTQSVKLVFNFSEGAMLIREFR